MTIVSDHAPIRQLKTHYFQRHRSSFIHHQVKSNQFIFARSQHSSKNSQRHNFCFWQNIFTTTQVPPEPPNINSIFTIPQINSLYFLIRASRFSKFYCGRLLVTLCAKHDHDKAFNYKIGSWEVLCNCASQRNICTKEQVRHKKIFVISTSWLILPRASSGFLEERKFKHLTMLVTGCRLLLLVVDGGGGWLLVVGCWLLVVGC